MPYLQSQHCLTITLYMMAICTMVYSPHSASMGSIYAEHKDEDGFLYVAYSGENTFGH